MSARITLASLSARMDAFEASQHEVNRITAELLTRLNEQVGASFATPAPVVTAITEAPSAKAPAKARKGKGGTQTVTSFAKGEALAATGVSADKILVPAGKLGREGTQTLTQARAKRAEAEASRVAYLADRKAGVTPERKPAKATTPKATANPYFAMSRSALDADGSKGAKAEIARREAKRASKTA